MEWWWWRNVSNECIISTATLPGVHLGENILELQIWEGSGGNNVLP